MKKKVYFVILVMLLPLFLVFGQEPTIEIVLETDHFLFGQTTWAKYTIVNSSERPIYVGGYQSESGDFQLLNYEAKAFYLNGKMVPQHVGGEMITGKYVIPKKALPKGESLVWSQPIPVTDVTIEELPPGEYKLVFSLKYSLKADEGVFDKEAQTSTKFYIDKPEGEDAAWLQYVSEAKKKLFEENPTKLALKRALGWGDVLECGFCPSGYRDLRAELLQKFPTSTYAGYELAKNGCEDLENYVNLTSDEIIDDVLGVRWRPDRDTYKEEVKAKYSEKLKMLRNFILAHPDFAKTDMIHSAIARSLLILGRQNEAIEEMKILSKMEGKFAEGARRALEKIDQEKCKAKTNEEINKNERKSNPEGKKE